MTPEIADNMERVLTKLSNGVASIRRVAHPEVSWVDPEVIAALRRAADGIDRDLDDMDKLITEARG